MSILKPPFYLKILQIYRKGKIFMARYRDKRLTIRLTEDELNTIKTRMELAGSRNATDFILTCVCSNTINVIDTIPLLSVKTELSRIGNNINQVARIANTAKSIHYDDVQNLKEQVDEMRKVVGDAFDFCVKER